TTTNVEYDNTLRSSPTEEGSTKSFTLTTDFSPNALNNKAKQTTGLNLSDDMSSEQD
ncbi:899_t:CDS:1, partial [Scutellospora calospora]